MLRRVAVSENVPIALVDVWAPEPLLRTRIASRGKRAADPSEATLAILEQQLAMAEPVAQDEGLAVVSLDGRKPITYTSLAAISHRLFGARRRSEDLALA